MINKIELANLLLRTVTDYVIEEDRDYCENTIHTTRDLYNEEGLDLPEAIDKGISRIEKKLQV